MGTEKIEHACQHRALTGRCQGRRAGCPGSSPVSARAGVRPPALGQHPAQRGQCQLLRIGHGRGGFTNDCQGLSGAIEQDASA
jgi:hypothetical protein